MNFVRAVEDFLQIKCAFIIIDGAIMGIDEIEDMSVYDILYLMSDASVDKLTVASSSDNWTVVNYDDVAGLDSTEEEVQSTTNTRIYHTGKTSTSVSYMAREEELNLLRVLFNGQPVCINSRVSGVRGKLLEHKPELIDANMVIADVSDEDMETCLEVGFASGINYMLSYLVECETIEDVRELEAKIPFKYMYTVGTNALDNPLASYYSDSFDGIVNALACEYLGKNLVPERRVEVLLKDISMPGVQVVEED